MEYCDLGDLHHYLGQNPPLSVADTQQLTYQIIEGLHQMHENDFAHRDLKPGVSINTIYKLRKRALTLPEHPHQINATDWQLVDRPR
jgi:serine/threonine protein kinase